MINPDEIDFSLMSTPERLMLAQRLLDSVLAEATPLSDAQLHEMNRRAAAIDSGEAVCESWDALRGRIPPLS